MHVEFLGQKRSHNPQILIRLALPNSLNDCFPMRFEVSMQCTEECLAHRETPVFGRSFGPAPGGFHPPANATLFRFILDADGRHTL